MPSSARSIVCCLAVCPALERRAATEESTPSTVYPLPVSCNTRGGYIRLPADAAGQHVLVHRPVADEAVEWVLERRRMVVLEKGVADPGKAIAGDERCGDPPRITRDDCSKQATQCKRRSNEMQSPARRAAVLGQIERIEIGERRKTAHSEAH